MENSVASAAACLIGRAVLNGMIFCGASQILK